jgi:hypothetical protein
MARYLVIMLFFICSSFKANDYILLKTIEGNFDFFTTDKMGSIYVVKGSSLYKYDALGNLLKTFSEKSHGDITSVDASDPFKLLVYYSGFRQIVFLDNMLSTSGDLISLNDLGLQEPTLVCASYENGFWVYDQTEFKLVRYDKSLKISNQSGNIPQLTGTDIKPSYILESGSYLFVNDPLNGIYIFDKYGTYYKALPFPNSSMLQIADENIFYVKSDKLIRYNFKSFEEKTSDLPAKNVTNSRFYDGYLVTQDSTGIKIYQADEKEK